MKEPYYDLLDAMTLIDLDDLKEKGIDSFKEGLNEKYEAFKQSIWRKSLHDETDIMPDEEPVSFPVQDTSIRDSILKLDEGVQALVVLPPISAANEVAHNVVDGEDCLLDGGSLSNDVGIVSPEHILNMMDLSSVPPQLQTAITQEAVAFCGQIAQMSLAFVMRMMSMCANSSAADTKHIIANKDVLPIKAFYRGTYFNEEQFRQLYHILLSERWIDDYCTEDEFVYFFTGKGDYPTHPIHWKETSVLLALFLEEVVEDRRIWSKTAAIVEVYKEGEYYPVNRERIKSVYRTGRMTETFATDHYPKIQELLKKVQ